MGCSAVGARFDICGCGRWKPAWIFTSLKKTAATYLGPDMPRSAGGLCRRGDLDEAAGRDGSCSSPCPSCTRGAGCTVAKKESCGLWVRAHPPAGKGRLTEHTGMAKSATEGIHAQIRVTSVPPSTVRTARQIGPHADRPLVRGARELTRASCIGHQLRLFSRK